MHALLFLRHALCIVDVRFLLDTYKLCGHIIASVHLIVFRLGKKAEVLGLKVQRVHLDIKEEGATSKKTKRLQKLSQRKHALIRNALEEMYT